jgi:hypothetical protein
MDIGLPTSSPSGVNFMPSSPPPQSNGLRCWLEDLNEQFMDYVLKQRGLQLLTPIKRQDYRHYLNNRQETSQDINKAARRRAAADKYWALTFFELQDN